MNVNTIEYDGIEYVIQQVTGDVYRVSTHDGNSGVVMTVEHKGGGSYFKYRSSWKNNRTYSATRYSYKWIPVMREATFHIAKTEGLYDYSDGKFYRLNNQVWEEV